YYISLGTDLGNGLFKREDFNSYNVKANLDSKTLDRLKISTTLSYNYNEHKSGSIDNISQAFFFQPTYNIHEPDGSYTTYTSATGDVSYNPVTLNKSVDNKTIGKNFMGSASADLTLIDGLVLESKLSVSFLDTDINDYESNLLPLINYNSSGRLKISNIEIRHTSWENTLSYKTVFGKNHSVNAVAGASFENKKISMRSITGIGFSNNDLNSISGAQLITDPIQDKQVGILNSYFGRLKYNFKH